MNIRILMAGFGFAVIAVILSGTIFAAQGAGQNVPATRAAASKGSKDTCLTCHGPFDKIVAGSTNYTAPSGEKISPHRYVPHDSKKVEDIPECTNCHVAHSLDPPPGPGSVDLSKVGVQWCYSACHHEKNFTSCKECHS